MAHGCDPAQPASLTAPTPFRRCAPRPRCPRRRTPSLAWAWWWGLECMTCVCPLPPYQPLPNTLGGGGGGPLLFGACLTMLGTEFPAGFVRPEATNDSSLSILFPLAPTTSSPFPALAHTEIPCMIPAWGWWLGEARREDAHSHRIGGARVYKLTQSPPPFPTLPV